MAKKRRSTSSVPTLLDQSASMASGLTASAMKNFGSTEIMVGRQSEAAVVGLPLPALALRVVFDSTCFALSRILQIAGEEGSCKTALMNEIGRWHLYHGGVFNLAENENKDAKDMRHGIIQDEGMIEKIILNNTYAMEEWQSFFTRQLASARDLMDSKGGPGKTIPLLFAVDSLTSTDTLQAIDAVTSTGFASMDYARLANLISRYMKTMPKQIRNYPFTVLGTNHMKPATNQMGLPTKNIPGGKSVKFMETYEIHMTRIQDIDKQDYGGVRVKIKCQKNSAGRSRRSIDAEFLWWYELDGDGELVQKFMWDWDQATTEYLIKLKDAKGGTKYWNEINEIVDIRVISKSQRKVASKKLGISDDAPISYQEFARRLESDPVMMRKIEIVLRIPRGNVFQAGMDYRAQVAQAASQVQEATRAQMAQEMVDIE